MDDDHSNYDVGHNDDEQEEDGEATMIIGDVAQSEELDDKMTKGG